MSDVNLFLVGKTGNGKSSTGNSLLGKEAFATSDSSNSVTNKVQTGSGSHNGRNMRVVDGTGLADTRMDTAQAIKSARRELEAGVTLCPGGVTVFLVVLKYGNRYTGEEQATLATLRDMLGKDFLARHGVVVFTHGELFDMNNQRNGLSFAQWQQQQTGELRALIDECGNRCILAYNASPEKWQSQIDCLLNYVTTIQKNAGCYTHAMFLAQSNRQEQLIVQANAPQLRREFQQLTEGLQHRLSDIKASASTFDDRLNQLASLGGEVRQCRQRAVDADKGTGVLTSQQQILSTLGDSVASHEVEVRGQKSADEQRKREEQLKAEHEAKLEALRHQDRRSSDPCSIL